MFSTADSTQSVTDSRQVTADFLPKTQRGIIHYFNKCTKGGDKLWLGQTSLEVSCQTTEMAQPSRCLPSSLV